jgi:transcription termination factor Rho
VAAAALEQSILESKDKDTLLEMAKALGVKVNARLKKGDIIDKILDTTGSSSPAPAASPSATEPGAPRTNGSAPSAASPASNGEVTARPTVDDAPVLGADGEPLADWEIELLSQGGDGGGDVAAGTAEQAESVSQEVPLGSEPLTSTEFQPDQGQRNRNDNRGRNDGQIRNDNRNRSDGNRSDGNRGDSGARSDGADGESGNRRRRRRRKGRGGQDGPQGEDAELVETAEVVPQSMEDIDVAGYLDIRDEGYGFLRVKGYLPSKDDAYVPLRLARQYGLRKGDHITGKVRPAGRNEKNPGLVEIYTLNGADPELMKRRPNFEDLTALFPDQRLTLENPNDPTNMTARIIDLVSPIGKGQRGIIVSPPKAGKTTVMKTIAQSIEQNNPEVELMVLLIDERPEEVTDMRRTVKGEVISSTFDRPSEEHTHVAEMAIAKAKRRVEEGKDVVIILDGITRLSRAYNLAAPASGRILSGGIDAGALYPPKKFFGAARNVEEGGSLTILATALVDTNSRMDEAIFEEFKGTGNMELRLDRRVAERRIYPAIDVDASSTRHEELLFDRKQLQQVWKLRRVLSGLAQDGSAAAGLELLIDRLKTFRTNDEFLAEIAKQPSM